MRRIVPIFLSTVLLFTGCSSNSRQAGSKQTPANVQASKPVYIMVGKIEANEKADITSKIPAKVTEIAVDIGTIVKKGDSVFKLDTRDLEAQVEQAQAGVNTAKANLTKALSGARPELIAQAKAAQDSTGKNFETTKNNYDRTNQLFQSGAASKQQLESAELVLKTSEAQYNSAKEQLDMLNRGETKETLSVLEAQVKQAEASLELAKTLLANGSIQSPVNGVVSSKNINIGELAVTGAVLVSIVNTDSLFINAYLPAGLIGEVKSGQELVVKVSEIQGKEFLGEASVINPVIDSKGKNVLVKVKIKNPDPLLKPGMFAQIGLKK